MEGEEEAVITALDMEDAWKKEVIHCLMFMLCVWSSGQFFFSMIIILHRALINVDVLLKSVDNC
jgi:hypothetical protein